MKVRQRLALQFMLASGFVTLSILIFIYLVTRGFVHSDFIDRLSQQANLEALHYAAPDVKHIMPSDSFNLGNPSISIFSVDSEVLYTQGDLEIPLAWIRTLGRNDRFTTERNEYTILGKKYKIKGTEYYVFISDQDVHGHRELNLLFRAIIIGWIISLLLSYYAGLYFSKRALAPVRGVMHKVNQVTEDTLGHKFIIDKDKYKWDEIDELKITFNDLLSRMENAFLVQRRFVQNASHELKTPLTSIMAEIELALQRPRTGEEYRQVLEIVLEGSDRLAKTTQGLLTLTRFEEVSLREGEMDACDIVEIVQETITIFNAHYHREIRITTEIDQAVIMGNHQLLQTALLNVLDNAYKYSSDPIDVNIKQFGNTVIVCIKDRGIGIPADELKKITTPLFRASNVGGVAGAGLGLALVERIIKAHAGQMEITSKVGFGTQCKIELDVRDQWK